MKEALLPLNAFEVRYSEFCEGYILKKLIVEEEKSLLDIYGIKITKRLTEVYRRIRWKRADELREEEPLEKKRSSLLQFLEEECVQSSHDKDFVLASELEKQY